MQLVEAEIRPRKSLFHLSTAEAILAEARTAIGDNEPKVERPAARRCSRCCGRP